MTDGMNMRMDKFCSALFVHAGILVIACFGFGSCLPDPLGNAEIGKVNVAVQSNLNDCVLLKEEKWVLKSYFDKYGALEDRIFDSFKENELAPCACELVEDNPGNALTLSGLERRVIGEGSHRRLSTSIRMDIQDGSKDQQQLIESCKVIVIESLPAGVFADPFELQHLLELGGKELNICMFDTGAFLLVKKSKINSWLTAVYGDVAVFGDTNLELPSFLSNRSAVEIHMNFGFKKASMLKSGLEIQIEIPLHARYPAPHENGYSSVQFGECDVFVRCSPKSNLCSKPCLSILMAGASTNPINDRLVWEIPSGIPTHARFISNFTFLAAAMASMTIIASSLFCSRQHPGTGIRLGLRQARDKAAQLGIAGMLYSSLSDLSGDRTLMYICWLRYLLSVSSDLRFHILALLKVSMIANPEFGKT